MERPSFIVVAHRLWIAVLWSAILEITVIGFWIAIMSVSAARTVYRRCQESEMDANIIFLVRLYALRMQSEPRTVAGDEMTQVVEEVVTHTKKASTKTKVVLQHATGELCSKLKLNVEATDAGTQAMMSIASAVHFELMFAALAVACFFCGSAFLATLASTLAAAKPVCRTVSALKIHTEEALRQLGSQTPHTMSFSPHRIRANAQRKQQASTASQLHAFDWEGRVADPWGLSARTESVSERHWWLCLQRHWGALSAKNFGSIYRRCRLALGRPVRMARGRTKDELWCLTGPGCRSFLAWYYLQGISLGMSSQSTQAADLYSNLMIRFHVKLGRVLRKMRTQTDAHEDISAQLEVMETWEPVDTQFFCCECSKILNYLRHGNVIYLRGYWKDMEAKLNADLARIAGGCIQDSDMEDGEDEEDMDDDGDYMEEP